MTDSIELISTALRQVRPKPADTASSDAKRGITVSECQQSWRRRLQKLCVSTD
jgi:hypothetical protein